MKNIVPFRRLPSITNILLCAAAATLSLGIGLAAAGEPSATLDREPAGAACARLDDALTNLLMRPNSGHLVAIALGARRALACPVAQRSCDLVAAALTTQAAESRETEIVSTLGLHSDLRCPGGPLVDLVERAAASALAPLPRAGGEPGRPNPQRSQRR